MKVDPQKIILVLDLFGNMTIAACNVLSRYFGSESAEDKEKKIAEKSEEED